MRRQVNCITINTDASWHPEHKVGGYAFWIVCDAFKIQKSGMFKTKPNGSTDAEIMAIGNALATLLALPDLPEAKWLIVNTDSMQARDAIKAGKEGRGKQVSKLRQRLIKTIGSTQNKIRHVKAHTKNQDARSIVNEWCDTEAKKWMRQQVALIPVKKIVEDRFNQ